MTHRTNDNCNQGQRGTRVGPRVLLPALGTLALLAVAPLAHAAMRNEGPINQYAQGASTLKQRCIKAGLQPPKRLRSRVSRPGDRKKQAIFSYAYYRPMPTACHGVYRRVPHAKLQLQNPRKPKRWFNVTHYSWPLLADPGPRS